MTSSITEKTETPKTANTDEELLLEWYLLSEAKQKKPEKILPCM